MLQVTSREFRENQAAWFDRADAGEQVVIKRRGKRSYILTPIMDEDIKTTSELEQKIAKARKAYLNGETVSCRSAKEAIQLLESL